jgi:predicted DNA binding CopG/RHH family protein
MLEIRAELTQEIEDGTFNLQDIDEDEAEHLKKQLLDHRNHNKRSMRVTSKAAQMDGRLTARLVSDTVSYSPFAALYKF